MRASYFLPIIRSGETKRGIGRLTPRVRGQRATMTSDERDTREREASRGFPEPPGVDPDDRTRDRDPHHALNNPAEDPDPTEWPDPYERRDDPRDPPDPDSAPFGEEPRP